MYLKLYINNNDIIKLQSGKELTINARDLRVLHDDLGFELYYVVY